MGNSNMKIKINGNNFAALIAITMSITACTKAPDAVQSPQAAQVTTANPVTKSITTWTEYTGRFVAMNDVELRSRVTGFITAKNFTDGQIVKKGDVLFEIDPRTFEFQLQQRESEFKLAQKEYARAQELRQSNAIAQEDVDRRLQELMSAEAVLEISKLDLSFTKIRAPIDGKVSNAFIDIGNLVRQNDTVLTRVVSIDPIHIEIEASQSKLLEYIRLDRSGRREGSDTSANAVFVKLDDEDRFTHGGRMDFVDNVVDEQTGTILGRALMPNSDAIFYPGMFAQVRLVGQQSLAVLLIPESSIQYDQGRQFVFVVDEQDKIQRKYIETQNMLDNGMIPVKEGLQDSDEVVIAGVQRIRMPEQLVNPTIEVLEVGEISSMPNPLLIPSITKMMEAAQSAHKSSISEPQG
jgi:RND family efflux transporter MFP subunit